MKAPPEKMVDEWGAKAFSLLGYGECEALFDFDKKEIRTVLRHNPVALSSKVKGKVDWIARGYAAGVAEAVFKEPCVLKSNAWRKVLIRVSSSLNRVKALILLIR